MSQMGPTNRPTDGQSDGLQELLEWPLATKNLIVLSKKKELKISIDRFFTLCKHKNDTVHCKSINTLFATMKKENVFSKSNLFLINI